jgi:hypothetical protein
MKKRMDIEHPQIHGLMDVATVTMAIENHH